MLLNTLFTTFFILLSFLLLLIFLPFNSSCLSPRLSFTIFRLTSKLTTLCGYTSADAGRFLLFSQISLLDICQLLRTSSAILLIFLIFVILSLIIFLPFITALLSGVILNSLYIPRWTLSVFSGAKLMPFVISDNKNETKTVTFTLNF